MQSIEKGRRVSRKRLRMVAEALGLDITLLDGSVAPLLTTASDEELIRELRRRSGGQSADFLRGYLEAKRADEATDPDTSQSGNDAAGDNAAS